MSERIKTLICAVLLLAIAFAETSLFVSAFKVLNFGSRLDFFAFYIGGFIVTSTIYGCAVYLFYIALKKN